jgi:hypothetical protein
MYYISIGPLGGIHNLREAVDPATFQISILTRLHSIVLEK